MRLVPMAEAHVDAIVAIERELFVSPWRPEHFLFEIRESEVAVNRTALDVDGEVLGYACVWIVARELKINNLAVAPARQRDGVGRWMLACLLSMARRRGCREASLEVRPSNRAARELYAGFGFVETHRRPGYYAREGEDAIVMELLL